MSDHIPEGIMERSLKNNFCSILGKTMLEFDKGLGERLRILFFHLIILSLLSSNLTPSVASIYLLPVHSQTTQIN